jgi:transposase
VGYLGTSGTRPWDRDQLSRNRQSKATQLLFIDEAGPCGSWLSRDRPKTGSEWWVVAPSLMPKKAGDRVKTDRRAAVSRARLMRSGELTPVSGPTAAAAALRARTRAREAALRDLQAATGRLQAFSLRHDIRYPGPAHRGPAPLRWRAAVVCPPPAPQSVFPEDVRALTAHTERLQRWEQALPAQVTAWRLHPVVAALQALRGVQGTVAVATGAALGDLTRFEHPRELMKGLGLIPSADSRAERRRQGAITTAGNPQARRAVVAGAWASRDPANVSRPLQRRRATHPKAIQDLRWTAQGRLCKRFRRLAARGTHAHHVGVASARDLVGFRWAMAKPVPVTAESPLTKVDGTHP